MVKFLALGILTGIIIGFLAPLNISLINEKFLLILLLVGFDVLFASINAKLLQQFDYLLFTNEFILNSILSVGLVYLGIILGLDLFSIIALVLTLKMFYNLSKLTKSIVQTIKKNSY
ncbi:MAG: DUF1290 domain-containing protein [Candidatus Gastranaerophilales bacterium]|nr:DUF1290 domain-containing protein [Candidatus Gastranaerophilales bacterium]